MKVQYFSWIKERTGKSIEVIDLDDLLLKDFLDNLMLKNAVYKDVFGRVDKFCITVNDKLISPKEYDGLIILKSDNICFFPPISGG